MNPDSNLARRRPRLRLWHLFAFVTLAAVLVWLCPRVGVEVDHKPGVGSRVAVVWQGEEIELWDTYPLRPVNGFSTAITYDENGIPGFSVK